MKVLELFAGTECMSNAFRARGHECYTVDWDWQFPSNLHIDIGILTADQIRESFGNPDVIFAAFDCRTFSMAASTAHHRQKNPETGNLDPLSDYAKKCDQVDQHCLELIKELNPAIYIIENPRGGLRSMTWMKDIPVRNETTYCQYGFPYMKPTDFFSNIDLQLKPPCKNGDPCHERAPRGSSHGVQGLKGSKERSVYPPALCEHIVRVCEERIG